MAELPDTLPGNRRTSAFERRVASALDGLIVAGEFLVVACSGGPDSVAALVAVCRVMPSSKLVAAHFDHGLRPRAETEADAAFVRALSMRIGARFALGCPDEPLAPGEAAARAARYRWLASVLVERGASAAVTGHTEDDQAETVLLNLARGAGLRGAGGMRRESAWPVGSPGTAELRVLRPLLGESRAEVEGYLAALRIEPRLDPSNETLAYARNRVRQQALPALESVNPEVRAHLAGFAERASEADAALEAWAGREFTRLAAESHDRVRIDRRELAELPPAVAKRVLSVAARRVGLELGATQQAALLGIAPRRGAMLDLSGGRGWTDDDALIVIADGSNSGR